MGQGVALYTGQYVGPSGSKVHVLVKVRGHLFNIRLVNISSNDENSLWMCTLQIINGVVECVQCLLGVCERGYVNSTDQYNRTPRVNKNGSISLLNVFYLVSGVRESF